MCFEISRCFQRCALKVFVLAPREDWICDRLVSEWYQEFDLHSTRNIHEADVIWILAGWCWNHVPVELLKNKKVVVTEHHIVPEKFTEQKYHNFIMRDQFVDCYHVPSIKTKEILSKITKKRIEVISYWLNDKFWQPIEREKALSYLNLPREDFYIGSFQRDTEGHDLKSPKLEKGPDLFCDYIEKHYSDKKNLHIVLGGWRRQYVINRLENSKIKYSLFERTDLKSLKYLYAICNLYVVASRHEGGPQSIIEASAMKIPIISTDVGIASNILSQKCIIDVKSQHYIPTDVDIDICKNNVNLIKISLLGKKYLSLFESLI